MKQLPIGTRALACSVLILSMAKNQSDVENLVENCPKTLFTLLDETETGTASDHITLILESQDESSLQIAVYHLRVSEFKKRLFTFFPYEKEAGTSCDKGLF